MRLLSRLLSSAVILCAIAPLATGQTVVSSNLILTDASSGYTIKLLVPSLTSSVLLNLPTTPGTLLVNQGGGISGAWLSGGNDLTSAGPSENRIGSTTAQDVDLIAGGDVKLRLGSSGTLTATDGTKLAFQDDDESNISSFVAGNQTNDIAYTLPTTTPAAGQYLWVANVFGNDVTLGWAGGSSSSYKATSANVSNTDDDDWLQLTDLTTSVVAGGVYKYEFIVDNLNTNGGEAADIRFSFPSGTLSTLSERIGYFGFGDYEDYIAFAASPVVTAGIPTTNAQRYFRLSGLLKVGGTGGSLTVEFKMNNNENGTRTVTIKAGSYLILQKL